jgi:hypothetical protein
VHKLKKKDDIKETAKIQKNVYENIFIQSYEKLWNSANTNEPKFEWII